MRSLFETRRDLRGIEIIAGDLPITMTLTSLKVLPVDDDEFPRDTQLNFVGGLPDGAESVRYRVNETMPNTAVRLFLEMLSLACSSSKMVRNRVTFLLTG